MMATGNLRKKIKKEPGCSSHSDNDTYDDHNKDDFNDADLCEEEIPPSDFFCKVCKAPMNSLLVWNAHVQGKKHKKKVASASFSERRKTKVPQGATLQQIKVSGVGPMFFPTRPSNEIANIQEMFNEIEDEYIVGLDFITEIWRKDDTLEPVYHCSLCKADCQVISIINHVIGFRHRTHYIKYMDENMLKYFSYQKKSYLSGEVAEVIKELQQIYGKGLVKVENEVSEEEEEEEEESDKSKKHAAESDQESAGLSNYPPIKLKVKSVDAKHVSECFFSLDEAKKAAILCDVKNSNIKGVKRKDREVFKQQLMMLHDTVLFQNLSSLSTEEMMTISRQFMNGDFSAVSTLINFQDVEENAKRIIKIMRPPKAEKR